MEKRDVSWAAIEKRVRDSYVNGDVTKNPRAMAVEFDRWLEEVKREAVAEG